MDKKLVHRINQILASLERRLTRYEAEGMMKELELTLGIIERIEEFAYLHITPPLKQHADRMKKIAQGESPFTIETELWCILVPTHHNNGIEIKETTHHIWDEKVRKIVGGLTLNKTIKGVWGSEVIYRERMIPVHIGCSKREIEKIIDMTKVFYKQEKVMAYLISPKVIIK
tara:strand:+ start:1099 stop:1614 length:516 start_codon:yes stop_codon:yes gene_type:complete